MTMHKFTSSPYAAVFVGAVLLLGAYVGVYYAMVSPIRALYPEIVPYYSLGPLIPTGRIDSIADPVFEPMHQLDRKLRPSVWHRKYPPW